MFMEIVATQGCQICSLSVHKQQWWDPTNWWVRHPKCVPDTPFAMHCVTGMQVFSVGLWGHRHPKTWDFRGRSWWFWKTAKFWKMEKEIWLWAEFCDKGVEPNACYKIQYSISLGPINNWRNKGHVGNLVTQFGSLVSDQLIWKRHIKGIRHFKTTAIERVLLNGCLIVEL